ncbi:MAG: YajD family HNH nuclease [Psychromonas sp.]|nr:YajD family HNH nuclease [Psychromonas sp.]
MAHIPVNYKSVESDYRDKALKIFPWICGKCAREFVYSNLKELTVHHIDHDHSNNPANGSNWELLCLYCHDHEHDKYTQADLYGATSTQEDKAEVATYKPFADLMDKMKK